MIPKDLRYLPSATETFDLVKQCLLSLLLGLAMMFCLPVVGDLANGSPVTHHEPINKRTALQLYRKYCIECHGQDGRAQIKKGKFSHARNLADAQWQDEVSDERIFNSIVNGRNIRGNMPAFGKQISDQEVEALVAYVRHLRK
jgi:mono/diheme cytochrome c family protein